MSTDDQLPDDVEPVDDFIDIGDMPEMPDDIPDEGIQDAFGYDVAFKLAFIGIGQGGSRIAEAFYQLGYRSVVAINTAVADLRYIKLPPENKYDMGGGGAGKDPSIAAAAAADKDEDLYDLYKRCLGDEIDCAILCLGAGGGTGAGAWPKAHQVLQRYLEETKRPTRIGMLAALPRDGEGQRPARNAVQTMAAVAKQNFSPLIVVDNERIQQLFRNAPQNEWSRCNNQITSLFHLFNRIAAQDSPHTSFDRQDLAKLLDSGTVIFGATAITEYQDAADISRAVRQQLQANTLASTDLGSGNVAGCVFILGREAYATVDSRLIDHGFESLNRILGPDSTVFRGIYPGNNADIRCYTMIGNLDLPAERIRELERVAGG